MRLVSDPFALTGTLRDNIDPLAQYRDRDILRSLSYFRIKDPLRWKVREDGGNPSEHFLDQRINYEDIPTTLRNSIGIVRAMLRQPKLLVCDNLQPNMCVMTAEELLGERLQ